MSSGVMYKLILGCFFLFLAKFLWTKIYKFVKSSPIIRCILFQKAIERLKSWFLYIIIVKMNSFAAAFCGDLYNSIPRRLIVTKWTENNEFYQAASKFGQHINDEQRFILMIEEFIKYGINFPIIAKLKSSQVSIDVRKRANQIYASSKNDPRPLMKAHELYSKCIATAPNESEEIAVAYANRSAANFHLNKFQECLKDVNRALGLKYPALKRGKLILRKVECLNHLENKKKNNLCEEILKDLEHKDITEDDKIKIIKELEKAKNEMTTYRKCTHPQKPQGIPKIRHPHDKYPCASDAIQLAYNKEHGRHLIAARDINCGEILAIEKSFCNYILIENAYTHCAQCNNGFFDLIPCDYCIYAMYCSEGCKTEAWNSHHNIDCKVFGHLKEMEVNTRAFFALRALLQSIKQAGGLEQLETEIKKIDSAGIL